MADSAAPLALSLQAITPEHRSLVGGKGYALACLAGGGFVIPRTLCLTTEGYRRFVGTTGLLGKIVLVIGRKPAEEMRWEEMWDTALRIRNLFDRTALPPELEAALREAIEGFGARKAMAVRSSALGEDSPGQSFAGLHESYLNVRGTTSILEHVRKVWASLWSDAALLYRRELGLEVGASAMAVVLQELIEGEVSGVAFGRSPLQPGEAVIEAVAGLNQALVDGAVEPDRWILERDDGKVLSYRPGERGARMVATEEGVLLTGTAPQEPQARQEPLLSDGQVQEVFSLARRAEELFGSPQDLEWTFREGTLIVLQSRPITAESAPMQEDRRGWYLSLRRSFDNLKTLRTRVEGKLIPELIAEGQALAAEDLQSLEDPELAEEIRRRRKRLDHWVSLYWEQFIPYAHGVRLFGEAYNDRLKPKDPFEFIEAVRPTTLESLERNRLLDRLVELLRRDPQLTEQLRTRTPGRIEHREFRSLLEAFLAKAGNLSFPPGSGGARGSHESRAGSLSTLLLEMAAAPRTRRRIREAGGGKLKAQAFLDSFPVDERDYAQELLELGRSSYRLRDDDNLHLGRIEREVWRAVGEGRRRLAADPEAAVQLVDCLEDIHPSREKIAPLGVAAGGRGDRSDYHDRRHHQDRQLVGQPAGEGLASGIGRVVREPRDLFTFKRGNILVCDALDPNMTFVIPLAAAVVERRGGMLIHGAIIAREYGIPCVTGIPELTARVPDGSWLTVDGYLGLVVLHGEGPRGQGSMGRT